MASGVSCRAMQAATNPWQGDIAKFDAADAKTMPPKNGVVFVGSSTIRFWETDKEFADLHVINRGFGGSEMADAAQFEPRIVAKYQPRLVVLYEGDNDLNGGKTPQQVFAAFHKFADELHADVPDARLIVISIKPSPSRWKLQPQMTEANALIKANAQKRGGVTYLDIVPLMLGGDGQPRKELYRADGLHMNPDGYKLWDEKLRPLLGN